MPMEKLLPHCKLVVIHRLVEAGRVRATWSALSGAAQLGFDFEEMVEVLRAEVATVRPHRLVLIGSSMGAYASLRAAIELNADVAVGFSPQVLLEPDERKAASLRPVPIDDNLTWLKIVGACEGFELTSLLDVVRRAPAACKTRLELHVGGRDVGDVREAVLLRDAVE